MRPNVRATLTLRGHTRGFRRQVLEEVAVYGELYRFLPVLAARQGFRVVEVRVRHREEKGRAGFYGVGVYLRRLLDILAITFLTRFTQRPLRFFGYLGFAAIAIGAPIGAKALSTAFMPPEATHLAGDEVLFRVPKKGAPTPYELLPAHPTLDLWSFFVVLVSVGSWVGSSWVWFVVEVHVARVAVGCYV